MTLRKAMSALLAIGLFWSGYASAQDGGSSDAPAGTQSDQPEDDDGDEGPEPNPNSENDDDRGDDDGFANGPQIGPLSTPSDPSEQQHNLSFLEASAQNELTPKYDLGLRSTLGFGATSDEDGNTSVSYSRSPIMEAMLNGLAKTGKGGLDLPGLGPDYTLAFNDDGSLNVASIGAGADLIVVGMSGQVVVLPLERAGNLILSGHAFGVNGAVEIPLEQMNQNLIQTYEIQRTYSSLPEF